MNPLFLGPVLELGKSLIDRFIPNPQEKAKAELDMLKMVQEGDLKVILAQLEINAKEATNPSIFVSGGRPFVIWICGFGFLYSSIIHNLLTWLASIKGWPVPPAIDNDILMSVLFALLGLSGLRTVDKVKKVASK